MARLAARKTLNRIVAHLPETNRAIRQKTNEVKFKASAGLARARGSTRWYKIIGPGNLTRVTDDYGDVDGFVNLEAPNPMAIEYGHMPSGVFGPDGRYGHIETKAPEGLYILNRAAGLLGE